MHLRCHCVLWGNSEAIFSSESISFLAFPPFSMSSSLYAHGLRRELNLRVSSTRTDVLCLVALDRFPLITK
jgi:hypothetical protein